MKMTSKTKKTSIEDNLKTGDNITVSFKWVSLQMWYFQLCCIFLDPNYLRKQFLLNNFFLTQSIRDSKLLGNQKFSDLIFFGQTPFYTKSSFEPIIIFYPNFLWLSHPFQVGVLVLPLATTLNYFNCFH